MAYGITLLAVICCIGLVLALLRQRDIAKQAQQPSFGADPLLESDLKFGQGSVHLPGTSRSDSSERFISSTRIRRARANHVDGPQGLHEFFRGSSN